LRTNKRHYRVKLEDVLTAHRLALLEGGLDGVRDLAAIEAAIARPYSGYYRTITGKAAALTHSLALNHGFIDANKRSTVYALHLFLQRSGYRFSISAPPELHRALEEMIMAVVEHRMNFDELVAWFQSRLIRA